LKKAQLKACESDFVPLWDGIRRCRSLAEHKLLEGRASGCWANISACVLFSLLKTALAAAFWISCRCLKEDAGRPAKKGFQWSSLDRTRASTRSYVVSLIGRV